MYAPLAMASHQPSAARANARELDIVVYGATGFTGQLVVDYLARTAPADLSIGIAGRDKGKLEEVREHARAKGRDFPIVLANVKDPATLRAMAARARVVITTVGPYVELGEPLVEACVAEGTDYVDITGEPEFVDRVLSVYGERAAAAGIRLVSCCGFDSIPHDLGAYFTMRELAPRGAVQLEGFVQAGGGISGGTWHSAIGAFSRLREAGRGAKNGAPRTPATGRTVRRSKMRPRHEPEVGGWVLPFASIDPAIVLRSARMLDVYGPDFSYGHFVRAGSLPKAVGLGAAVGAVVALSQLAPTRELLLRLKRQGEGPSEEVRKRGYFRVTFLARTADERMIARVSGGEPGYTETAKMISECALALACDRDKLPDVRGVLTPAVAFRDVLVDRLQRAGIRFEVVRRTKAAS
jgi:short subunit dehydrogenase-like uncharacterized protein